MASSYRAGRKVKLSELRSMGIVVTLDEVRHFAKGGPHGVWDDVLIPVEPLVLRDGSTGIWWFRRWLGDEAVVIFWLNQQLTAEELAKVEQIFPEAEMRELFESPLQASLISTTKGKNSRLLFSHKLPPH